MIFRSKGLCDTSSARFVLKADLSRFYHTLYTHTVHKTSRTICGMLKQTVSRVAGSRGFSTDAITVGDFDGDGKSDVAMSWFGGFLQNSSGIVVALGNGDGSFRRLNNIQTGIAASDLVAATGRK